MAMFHGAPAIAVSMGQCLAVNMPSEEPSLRSRSSRAVTYDEPSANHLRWLVFSYDKKPWVQWPGLAQLRCGSQIWS